MNYVILVKIGSSLALKLQKKALRIISKSFSDLREPSSPLFKEWKILKIKDIVEIQNCLFLHLFLKRKLPKSFETFFRNVIPYMLIPLESVAQIAYICRALKV